MRHVSRTHRIALDWLFDWINLDPKIQIGYIDTKHQLADILTKVNFTRDEWNHLLHLFNITYFSSTCCAQNSSLTSCTKNDGEDDAGTKERRKKCGKIKTDGNELVFNCFGEFLIRGRSACIKKPTDARERRNSKLDAASSSEGRLKDAYLGGLMDRVAGKPAATDKSQESLEYSESESWSNHDGEVTGKLVAS